MTLLNLEATGRHFRKRRKKLALFILLVSTALSAAGFIVLDYAYSSVVLRRSAQKMRLGPRISARAAARGNCRVRDSVLDHAFRPNCATIESWGAETYELLTNSLALRDETIREVPRVDSRPRLLMLGDSFTEGKSAWADSFVGRIARRFPQYDIVNGGVTSYSPSNYLNEALRLLATGLEFDEVIVFIDISDVQDEAA